MEALTKKEISKIASIHASVLCFRQIWFTDQDIKYNQISCATNKIGLIEQMYGCEDDLDITEESIYYLFWNKVDWWRKDYYLLNLSNLALHRHCFGRLKASVIALYCLLGLTTEVLYELVTGQKRTFK